MAPKKRRLLTIGMPVRLANLRAALESVDTDNPDVTVRYANLQLIVEEPQPTLPQPSGS